MGRLMNRHNAKLNAFAVHQLKLTPSDRVLEIGFGGGVTLPLLMKQAGFVGGVDRSLDMVKRAKVIFSDAVSSGRAEFRQGTVEALPFEVSSFEKVCTVNTVSLFLEFARRRLLGDPSCALARWPCGCRIPPQGANGLPRHANRHLHLTNSRECDHRTDQRRLYQRARGAP
jgi:methyltransferase family protein